MGLASLIGGLKTGSGSHVTPVAYSRDDGTMVGHNNDAWLWRIMPQSSLHWEDRPARAAVAASLSDLLIDLGRSSRGSIIPGSKIGAFHREFHLVALWWDQRAKFPDGTPDLLKEWLGPVFDGFATYDSLFAFGVKLRRSMGMSGGNAVKLLSETIKDSVGADPDPMVFAADRARLSGILGRAGGRIPTREEMLRLELWWNGGREADSFLQPSPDGRSIASEAWMNGLEISAIYDYEDAVLDPERGMWVAEAFGHPRGATAISIRGEMMPPKAARDALRGKRRAAKSRIMEQAATGDIDREEDHEFHDMAESLEQMFAVSGEPLMVNTSVLFARSLKPTASYDSFMDHLESAWGLKARTLDFRQVQALDEMLPCKANVIGRTKPFTQSATVGFVAESGISAFARVGDTSGVWIGLSIPNMHPVWLDPAGSSKSDKPPAMAVLGEPGAGKTFLLQLIASQAATMTPTVYINPKPADSLDGFANAIGGEIIKISSLEKEPGLLDPFRYAPPEIAADIAVSHISSVLSNLNPQEEVLLERAVRRAAISGAGCVGDALKHPDMPEEARDLVLAQAESNTLFALGISPHPLPPLGMKGGGGLTLIEFDRPLDLPSGSASADTYSRKTRIDMAAVKLVIRSSLEQMFAGGGGVLIADEAHVFMGSQEGRTILQRLGREGRSQQILPILATQRIADVMAEGVDMTSYLGRSIIMKMTDPKEVAASMELIGLENTPERQAWLEDASPKRGERGALALHRDLQGDCSAFLIGPIPDHISELFSTNPLDREARAAKQQGGTI